MTVDPPDAAELALFLADRLDAANLISLGGARLFGGSPDPEGLQIIGFDDATAPVGRWREWDFRSPVAALVPEIDWANSVLLAVDPLRAGDALLDEVIRLVDRVVLSVLTVPASQLERTAADLAGRGCAPVFTGRTRSSTEPGAPRDTGLLVIENPHFPLTVADRPTPDDFTVVAFLMVYNEEDVIEPCLEDLRSQGVAAYVIDNWSTDRTYELAAGYLGDVVVGIERSPADGPPRHFDLKSLLHRVEELSHEVEADWFLKHDADEMRRSAWPGVSLRDGLYRAQAAGFSSVDFTVVNFHPVDDGYPEGSSLVDYFRYFEFGRRPGHFRQQKAWRNFGQQINGAEFGSHVVDFAGRRVFPYKFLLRHYPVRSQRHGEKKVLVDRLPRFLPEARAEGWHTQYDNVGRGHSFVRDPEDLDEFDDAFMETFLAERLSGAGLPIDRNGAPRPTEQSRA